MRNSTLAEPNDALACYQKAVELKPDWAEAHNNVGLGLAEQGKQADAAASFRRALELNPHFAEVHHNLGNALLKAGRVGDARFESVGIMCYDDQKRKYVSVEASSNTPPPLVLDESLLEEGLAALDVAVRA